MAPYISTHPAPIGAPAASVIVDALRAIHAVLPGPLPFDYSTVAIHGTVEWFTEQQGRVFIVKAAAVETDAARRLAYKAFFRCLAALESHGYCRPYCLREMTVNKFAPVMERAVVRHRPYVVFILEVHQLATVPPLAAR